MKKLFGDEGTQDLGCYADGAFGMHHVNCRLADCLEEAWLSNFGNHPYAVSQKHIDELLLVLRTKDHDDSIDTAEEALDLLNTHFVVPQVYFGFYEGDLLLTTDFNAQFRNEGR